MMGIMGKLDDDEGGPLHEYFLNTLSYFSNVLLYGTDKLQATIIGNSNMYNQFFAFLNRML